MSKLLQILIIGIVALASINVYASLTASDYTEKGFLLGESAKYKEALKAFEKAIELDPQNGIAIAEKALMQKWIQDAY